MHNLVTEVDQSTNKLGLTEVKLNRTTLEVGLEEVNPHIDRIGLKLNSTKPRIN
jgi:hypothetical protein